jgi:hypothetical protein
MRVTWVGVESGVYSRGHRAVKRRQCALISCPHPASYSVRPILSCDKFHPVATGWWAWPFGAIMIHRSVLCTGKCLRTPSLLPLTAPTTRQHDSVRIYTAQTLHGEGAHTDRREHFIAHCRAGLGRGGGGALPTTPRAPETHTQMQLSLQALAPPHVARELQEDGCLRGGAELGRGLAPHTPVVRYLRVRGQANDMGGEARSARGHITAVTPRGSRLVYSEPSPHACVCTAECAVRASSTPSRSARPGREG